MIHVGTADEGSEEAPTEVPLAAVTKIVPDPLSTPRATSARAFHNWRDSSNPVLDRRERERRASQYIRA
jgi:hypothetical protein